MDSATLLVAILVIPLVACLACAALPSKRVPQAVFECIHVACVAAVLVACAVLVTREFTSGEPVTTGSMWFRLDALSAVFVTLIGVIGFFVGIFSVPYIRHDAEAGTLDATGVKSYYAFFSLFVFTMLLAALSNNIIMMWICVEATTLATVFLVGAYRTRLALEAAWKYVVVCTAGVAFGLYGTLLVYANAAQVMDDPMQAVFWTSIVPVASQLDPAIVTIAFTFVVVGFGTKAGLFPMHTWLPDAHSEAPSPVSALLSGVLLKCAVLVIVRFYVVTVGCVGTLFPRAILLTLGGLSVVMAALAVFAQSDLKRKLAYSSCENVGMIALCLGFGGPIGIAAALLHCVFHGFTKALMFCLSGNVLMKYGTRDLNKIEGVIEVAPMTAVLLMIGLFALSGFPPFAMFTSEIGAVVAGVQTGPFWLVVVVVLALTVVVAAFAKVAANSVLGHAPQGMAKKDVPALAVAAEAALAAVILWFGVALPQPVVAGVDEAASIVLQEQVAPVSGGSLLLNYADVSSAAQSEQQ